MLRIEHFPEVPVAASRAGAGLNLVLLSDLVSAHSGHGRTHHGLEHGGNILGGYKGETDYTVC